MRNILITLLGHRQLVILFVKTGLICLAFVLAFALRFDLHLPSHYWPVIFKLILPLLLIKLLVFRYMGLSTGWWRYASISDVLLIFKANIVASTLFILYVIFMYRLEAVPRSVLVLDGILCFFLLCGTRLATRAYREGYLSLPFSNHQKEQQRVLIIGAGLAGQGLVRELRQNRDLGMIAVGYLDDDPSKLRQNFQGVPVLGVIEQLPELCKSYFVQEVIIAIPSASNKAMKQVVGVCQKSGAKFKTLPGVGGLINGTILIQQIRNVDMEDLLGREAAQLDQQAIRDYLNGKRILVTGAAGSIGSELCRQLARFKPTELVLFDNAETALFHMENELRATFPDLVIHPVIGDVRNRSRVTNIFKAYQPEVVFHAAAYKHVPMMEENPAEAANNNVRGTRIVAETADQFGTSHFVMISTDKAVNPTNIMGATKRAAELFVQGLSQHSSTHFVTVRFGNVLGSNGSVIPTFREQIKLGGPVTVTHPEVTRFFMSIPEAAQLVLQAGSMGQSGEIFLLDMGESVKIVELAETMIRLSGFEPYEDIDIDFIGLRPGEKLYEELLLDGEGIKPTNHEKIRIASAKQQPWEELIQNLDQLHEASKHYRIDEVLTLLQRLVPEYNCTCQMPEAKRKEAAKTKSLLEFKRRFSTTAKGASYSSPEAEKNRA